MENVFYYPRIGKSYETKGYNGMKLLILGESHYCQYRTTCETCGKLSNRDDCNNFTIKVLDENYLAYKNGRVGFEDWMRTFTRFTNVVLDNQVDTETLIDFWDSVIFFIMCSQARQVLALLRHDNNSERVKMLFLKY